MKIINAAQVHASLNFNELIPLLKRSFANEFHMPQRQVHRLEPNAEHNHDAFALLPAWNNDVIGMKAFTYFPDNGSNKDVNRNKQRLYSKIMLFSREGGEPLALVDGTSVTYWRTAAVSALASQLLSRNDSNHLLLFGTGNLAPYLIHAHLSVRTLQQVTINGRNTDNIQALIAQMSVCYPQVNFVASIDLAEEIAAADIICCATAASTPLFDGAWLSPGTHLDCLGNHHRDHRECDSASVIKSRVYVDSLTNTLAEAGELLIPIAQGVFSADNIVGELADLCRNPALLRQTAQEITLFKSVGTAISDLVTAHHVYQSWV